MKFLFKVSDTLDNILEESGDEEESDRIVTQILDEIGIEITGKVNNITTYRVTQNSVKIFSFQNYHEILNNIGFFWDLLAWTFLD